MRITTNKEEYFYDIYQQIHPFLPNDNIKLAEEDDDFHKYELVHYLEQEKETITNYVTINEYELLENNVKRKIHQSTFCRQDKLPNLQDKYIKRTAKLAIYVALSDYLKTSQPWGALTGVKPTKIALEYFAQNKNFNETKQELINEYYVQPQKAQLLVDILQNQMPIIIDENYVDFYVNIPFCTTRCSYCTFLSCEISKAQKLVEPYVDCLVEEINFAKELIKKKKYKVNNIYVGGGTPTSLSAQQLDKILKAIKFDGDNEFTVEAGRPDTIDKEKLDVLYNNGVNRISINPQTFNEQSLKAIGRAHNAQDIINAYQLARLYPFKINMDLIVGLPYDSSLFLYSLDKTIALQPDNITVHTLSFKTKSPLTKLGTYNYEVDTKQAQQNVELARQKLTSSGYTPYYIYKQKNMVGNLENVGYCKENTKCKFNINSMEDFSSIIACGANAISKRIFPDENRIERSENVKDILTYINKIDEMKERKVKLFE